MSAEIDPFAGGYNFLTATETDWLVIILALAAVVYSGAHYFGYEFEYISHSLHFARSPWVRTTGAVLQNLAIDLIQFVLAILGIILLLVLQCKKAIYCLWRRHWPEGVLGFPRKYTSVFERVSVQYNTVNHSHYANAIRQRFHAARARLSTVLRWGVPVAFVLILLHGSPDDTITPSLREPEVRPYVVPAWVIRARPENRLLDGSNSHYRPADESLVFDKAYIARVQGLKSQDEEAQITKTEGIESQDWKTQVVGSQSEDFQSSKRGSKEALCTACQDETPSIDTQSFGDKSVESQRVTTKNMESPDETQRVASHSLSVQGVENRGSRTWTPGTRHMESQNDMEAQRVEAQGEDAQIAETSRIESPALESQGFESQSMETESTESQSASSESVNCQNMTSGTMESQNPIEAQDTESEGLEVQGVADVPSTKITHTRTIWHIESETKIETTTIELSVTETLVSDGIGEESEVKTQTTTIEPSVTETLVSNWAEFEPATTTISTERTILYDEAYRYYSVCQQKHCCQFP